MTTEATKQPTPAQLQERVDTNLKEAMETAAGRPFTEGTVDDFRLDLEKRGLKIIDTNRNRNHVDVRAYEQACYEKNFFRMAAEYLTKVCRENGFDFDIRRVEEQPAQLVWTPVPDVSEAAKPDAPAQHVDQQ